jgi:hypothetical protein
MKLEKKSIKKIYQSKKKMTIKRMMIKYDRKKFEDEIIKKNQF